MVGKGRGKRRSVISHGGSKNYALRNKSISSSAPLGEATSSSLDLQLDHTTITATMGAPSIGLGDTVGVTHVTNTDPLGVELGNEDGTTNNEDVAESSQGREGPRKLLGKNIETKLLDEVFRGMILDRSIDPPLVPLCRLVPHEAIRTATSSLIDLRASFDDPGYSPLVCTPIIVSLKRPGKQGYIRVTDVDRTLWGAVWVATSDAFDRSLPDEWKDLKGQKFIVWDGNHKVKAWMSAIRESYAHEPARHISVRCQFLDVSDTRKEGELLLALRATNEIATTHVAPTYAHELFLFQKFGMCNKESLLQQLSDEDKKWVEVELQAEQKNTAQGWYNVPAVVLALLVWKREVKALKQKLVDAIDRRSMSVEAFEMEKTKAENSAEKQVQSRAYKYLPVANPANGDGFFKLIWDYDWSPSNRLGPLSKDKLYIIAVSRITAERKQEVLHDLVTRDMKHAKYLNRYKDAPRLRRYLEKETYWHFLLQEAELVIDDLRLHGVQLPEGHSDFFNSCHDEHVDQAFFDIWCMLKPNATKSNSPELHHSAMRLVYRWAKKLARDCVLNIMPSEIQAWSKHNSSKCMYPSQFWEMEVSLWEMNSCPWWLDYPLDVVPPSEEEDFALFQAMGLEIGHGTPSGSDLFSHLHDDGLVAQESAKERDGSSIKRKSSSVSMLSRVKCKSKNRLEFDTSAETSSKWSNRSSSIQYCTFVEVMMMDVQNLMDNPMNKQIENWLARINAKSLSHCGAPCKEVVNVVWADFPTDLWVSKASPHACPPWNVWQRKLSIAASEVADAFVADKGWYITCGLTEHFPLVCAHARKKRFTLHRTLHIVLDEGYLREGDEEVIDLVIGLFYRTGYDVPIIRRDLGKTVDPTSFDASRSIFLELVGKNNQYTLTSTNNIVRGGAERSTKFWRWLLLTFTEKCDSIIDIFCGAGGLGRACIALQRHCLCIDNDASLFEEVLKDVYSAPSLDDA